MCGTIIQWHVHVKELPNKTKKNCDDNDNNNIQSAPEEQ